jgi:hypothetical protein
MAGPTGRAAHPGASLLAVFSAAALFVLLVWPTLRGQLATVGEILPGAFDRVAEWVRERSADVSSWAGGNGVEIEDRLSDEWMARVGALLGGPCPF